MSDFVALVRDIWRAEFRNNPADYGKAFEEGQRRDPEAAAAYVGHAIEPASHDTQELEVDARGDIVLPAVLLSEVHRLTVQTDDGPETFTVDYLDAVPLWPAEEERSE